MQIEFQTGSCKITCMYVLYKKKVSIFVTAWSLGTIMFELAGEQTWRKKILKIVQRMLKMFNWTTYLPQLQKTNKTTFFIRGHKIWSVQNILRQNFISILWHILLVTRSLIVGKIRVTSINNIAIFNQTKVYITNKIFLFSWCLRSIWVVSKYYVDCG